MDSTQVLLQFENLQNRVKLLVSKLKESENNLQIALIENTELKNTVKIQEQNLKTLQKNQGNEQKDFQKREFFAKLVQNTGGSSAEKVELKKALDDYIKEIDNCIAVLSN